MILYIKNIIYHIFVLDINKMRKLFLILIYFVSVLGFGQDSREFNHGTSILTYQENNRTKYYLTWSSSYNNSWEHDIYNETLHFNAEGSIITEMPNQVYIGSGSDEAQEPVNATTNVVNNQILTVWEDGFGADATNVRAQLHTSDGTIIRSNWLIAGGAGSQHSANTAHLNDKFLIFYADEAPPSTGGAVVKGKVIDDSTGNESQTISFTPNNEDHWWPVSVSNTSNTRTLIIWGNDGYAARGTVLYESGGSIQQAQVPQDYLTNIQQYYYQVEWLEHISKFILIARNGAYGNITNQSQICLIDIHGNITNTKTVAGGIIREAKPAIKWSECNQSYSVFYPSGNNNLTQVSINKSGVISSTSNQIVTHPDLMNIKWSSTGVWSRFITDVSGNELFKNQYIALFIMNDKQSNNIIKIPIHLDASLFCNALSVEDVNVNDFKLYPNPTTSVLHIQSENEVNSIIVYNNIGQEIKRQNGEFKTEIDLNKVPAGIYFIKVNLTINGNNKSTIKKIIKQ